MAAIEPLDSQLSWQQRTFMAPGGQWMAVYHSPVQGRTGETDWQASLLESPSGTDATPDVLRTISTCDGLLCPVDLQPWRFDSQMLVLLPSNSPPKLFDLVKGKLIGCEAICTPLTAQWAATRPLLLLVYFDHIALLDGDGRLMSTVVWEPEENEIPYTGWTADDDYFFLVRHPRKQSPPELVLFDPAHVPAMANRIALDPARLAPYDAESYHMLSRDRLSLIVEGGQRASATLLDTWRQIRWDAADSCLLLSIYRPTTPPFKPQLNNGTSDTWLCRAEEKWVSLALRFS